MGVAIATGNPRKDPHLCLGVPVLSTAFTVLYTNIFIILLYLLFTFIILLYL